MRPVGQRGRLPWTGLAMRRACGSGGGGPPGGDASVLRWDGRRRSVGREMGPTRRLGGLSVRMMRGGHHHCGSCGVTVMLGPATPHVPETWRMTCGSGFVRGSSWVCVAGAVAGGWEIINLLGGTST
jgi:hypothetical protein